MESMSLYKLTLTCEILNSRLPNIKAKHHADLSLLWLQSIRVLTHCYKNRLMLHDVLKDCRYGIL